jgi:hypothetical protein
MTTVEAILTHAMNDAEFADLLFADAEKTLAGYELSAEELASLKSMSRAEFDASFASAPEQRKSFGTLLMIRKAVDKSTAIFQRECL